MAQKTKLFGRTRSRILTCWGLRPGWSRTIRWPTCKRHFFASTVLRQAGFTLIEVAAAAVILAVGLLGLATITASLMRDTTYNAALTTAATLAEQKLEEIRREGYAGLPDANCTMMEDYGDLPGRPAYKRVVRVGTPYLSDGLKTVSVAVYWKAGAHSVTLRTLVAR